jgi:23S rRNA pseudouridine2604 synthase
LFASNGLELLSLKRLRLGRMNLAPLQPGQWRALLPYERF